MESQWTIEQLRQLMVYRRVLSRIFRSANPERELAGWIARGGSAEIVEFPISKGEGGVNQDDRGVNQDDRGCHRR